MFKWLVFEGIDCSGKTSCAQFVTKQLIQHNINVQFTAEPALDIDKIAKDIDEQYLQFNEGMRTEIRSVLKTQHLTDSDILTLFLIDRCGLLRYFKEATCDVICQDRSYISTLVYQSVYLDKPIDHLMTLNDAVFATVYDIRPDIIFYLKVSPTEARQRSILRAQDVLDEKAIDKFDLFVEKYDWLLEQQHLKDIDSKFRGRIITVNTTKKPLAIVKAEVFEHVRELILC